jgi:hypothetical protein
MKTIISLSAYFNLASGVLLLGYWYLYAVLLPYGELSDTLAILVANKNWTLINLLGSSGALLGIVGLVGLYISLGEQPGKAATLGFILALLGSILMFAALMRDTLLWPILVAHDPDLLSFTGPIYASKTFFPFFIFSGVLYTIGNLVFGLAIAGSGLYPPLAGHLLAWGALLFGLGPLFGTWQVVIRSIGITALSIGLAWLGLLMRKG